MLILLYLYFFFFSQKTADELRISDCSSDVCSSDLSASASRATINSATVFPIACAAMSEADACPKAQARTSRPRLATRPSLSRHTLDRKSVVMGQRVSVRLDLGGGRIIKKNDKSDVTIYDKLKTSYNTKLY